MMKHMLRTKGTPDPALTGPLAQPAAPRPGAHARRWLLLIHQLPAHPTSLRVRTWRRLHQIGALAVKHAVHALPDSDDAREDFEWLKTEIVAGGGFATVFVAEAIDSWSHDALVEEFRRSREEAYTALARQAEALVRRMSGRRQPAPRSVAQLRQRLAAIEQVDFFGSAGRDRVLALVRTIEAGGSRGRRPGGPKAGGPAEPYRARLWVTRPRPGVDRMASAWLIRRFVDPEATFAFAADRETSPSTSVPFDMFGVEFSHRGEQCTFEVLCETFQLQEPALAKIAAIVHDLDLKDARFGSSEAPAIGAVIDGLRLAHADDHQLLSSGITLFEALYLQFTQADRPSGPRPLARGKPSTRKPRRAR
jgi:hypothetical protein